MRRPAAPRRVRVLIALIGGTVTAIALTGCTAASAAIPAPTVTVTVTATATPAATPTGAATPPKDAAKVANAIKKAVPRVTKVVKVTEDNDPNNLIGRPTGYVSAAIVYDSRTACSDGLGADCGASIEQWPTKADAKTRSAYIEKLLKGSPILGSEYDIVRDGFLLRVAGKLKPSQEKAYALAFTALF